MYVGNGMMLHAPHTGAKVELTSISAGAFAHDYAGARRYLT
jgi:cell wall-associated NlpC family hydrolase